MKQCQFKVGDIVVYDGVVASVEEISTAAGDSNRFLCSLQSLHNEEMTCTVEDILCEKYKGDPDEFDDSDRLRGAELDSYIIRNQVGKITDAHIGDGIINY